ncbi:MAG: hypothetical protein H0U46_08045 [Actinobacteria bacterium]|nr:hypothetical protein [Actinomycetota bacterium]
MRIPPSIVTTEPIPEDVSEYDDAVAFWESFRDAGLPLPDLATYEVWEQQLARLIYRAAKRT